MAAPSILGNPLSRQEHAAQAAAMRDTLRLGRRCCCRWPAAPALRPLPHSAPTCPSTAGLLRPAGTPPAHSTPLARSAPPPLTRRPQRTPAAHRPGYVCGAPVAPPSRFVPTLLRHERHPQRPFEPPSSLAAVVVAAGWPLSFSPHLPVDRPPAPSLGRLPAAPRTAATPSLAQLPFARHRPTMLPICRLLPVHRRAAPSINPTLPLRATRTLGRPWAGW